MTHGARVMLSTPPAITMSAPPPWISRAAAMVACMPDPHRRLTVWPGTSTGKPASSRAMRATLRLSSPAWLAQPRMTSSTSAGLTCARSQDALSATAARSSGRTSFSWPPYRPIGVRAVATITASGKLLLGALREKGLDAGRELPARGLCLLEVGLELHRVFVGRARRPIDGPFRGGQRLARLGRDVSREVLDLLLEPVGRDHSVDDPETVGVSGLHGLAGEDHLQRDASTGKARQKPGGAALRHEADVDEGLGDIS